MTDSKAKIQFEPEIKACNFRLLLDKATLQYTESEKQNPLLVAHIVLSYGLCRMYANAKAFYGSLKKDESSDALVQATWKIVKALCAKEYDKAITILMSPSPLDSLFKSAAQHIISQNWEFIQNSFTSIHKKSLLSYGIEWNPTELQKRGTIEGDFLMPIKLKTTNAFDAIGECGEAEAIISSIEN
jgi:hypothetical protein